MKRSDCLPVPAWQGLVAVLLSLTMVLGVVYALVEYVGPWVRGALGVHWVPPTGGYFVIESGSPLAFLSPWGTLITYGLAVVFIVWFVRLYLPHDDTAGGHLPVLAFGGAGPIMLNETDDTEDDEE